MNKRANYVNSRIFSNLNISMSTASSALKKIKAFERQKSVYVSFPIFLGPHNVGHADGRHNDVANLVGLPF